MHFSHISICGGITGLETIISAFINKSLELLNPKGYLLYITPDNWMSYADRNFLIKELTALNIIHLKQTQYLNSFI